MGNKLYVGNLAYSVRDDSLQQAFSQFGTVSSAKVMMDRDTGRSKGFGFVEMGSDAEAQAAINGMNGQALDGRAIVVNEARPREDRPGGFGGGGGGGGSRGGSATAVVVVPAVVVPAAAAAAALTAAVAAAAVAAAPTAVAAAAEAVAATAVAAAVAAATAVVAAAAAAIDSAAREGRRERRGCLGTGAFFHSPRRFLRPRPANRRSNSAFGSRRSSLATHPIGQGMTR